MLTKEELERYNRQIVLPEFGEESQEKLKLSSALIVGLGGLGSISSLYLVASGIGRIGLIDNDIVSISNLQRQILYREDEVGMKKAELAKETLGKLNSNVEILAYDCFLREDNAIDIIKDYDIIIDATDNFKTRYLINDVCVGLGKPFVYGSIQSYSGQVSVFNLKENSCTYRDLFPNSEELSCKENSDKGVMGVLPSITASIQANETIKIITNTGEVLNNKLLTFSIQTNEFLTLNLSSNEKAREESLESFAKKRNSLTFQ